MAADTTGAVDTQAVEATQLQAGAGSTPQAGGVQTALAAGTAAEAGTGDSEETISLDEARKLRKEANSLRQRVASFEKAKAESDLTNMSELEKAQARIAELEKSASESQVREQERSLRLAAVEAATKLGYRSPDIAYRLLDQGEVDWADDGTPKNVEKLLAAVLEREAYLGKSQLPDLGGGPRGATPSAEPGMNEILRAATRGA